MAIDPAGGSAEHGTSGDFADCYRASFAAVLAFALVKTGRLHEAEDLTQDAFASLFAKWHEMQGRTRRQLRAYLFACVAKGHVTLVRRIIRWRRYEPLLRAGHDGSITHVEDEVLTGELFALLQTLSGRQRAVVVLGWVEGFTDHEIAEILNMTASSVRTYRERARKVLTSKLGTSYREADIGPGGGAS